MGSDIGACAGGCREWVRKRSDAIVVMVVRGEDMAFAVADNCAPADAAELVRELLPGMVDECNRARAKRRDAQTRKRAAEIAGHEAL